MNNKLQDYARLQIKEGLAQLSEEQQHTFKRMYSPYNLEASIDEVVNNMPDNKLDWAMTQIDNTLKKM